MEGHLGDEELDRIEQRASRATTGPWHVVFLDDEWAMQLVAIATDPRLSGSFRAGEVDHRAVLAATLVQGPRYVNHASERDVEDAEFIAAARTDVPMLVAEVRRLRAQLRESRDRSDTACEP